MKSFVKVIFICVVILGTVMCGISQKGIEIIPDDAQRKVDVLFNGKLFTSYIYPADLEKPVLYPIYTANGTVITRGFPIDPRPKERTDHAHHVGCWFNFGDVNGLDFWNNTNLVPEDEKPNFGSIRHRNVVNIQNGPNRGILEVEADWVDFTEKVLLKEETGFVFSGKGDWRIIERTTKLTAQKDTVTFTDSKEGLLAIRMDRVFEEPPTSRAEFVDSHGNVTIIEPDDPHNQGINGQYRNSEGGEMEKGVWGKPAKWVSLSAEKEGEKISVAVIDHKNNPGHPAHSHARGYGLFSTNNMGAKVFHPTEPLFVLQLKPGESTTFKYLIVVKTNGFVTDDELNKLFEEFK